MRSRHLCDIIKKHKITGDKMNSFTEMTSRVMAKVIEATQFNFEDLSHVDSEGNHVLMFSCDSAKVGPINMGGLSSRELSKEQEDGLAESITDDAMKYKLGADHVIVMDGEKFYLRSDQMQILMKMVDEGNDVNSETVKEILMS